MKIFTNLRNSQTRERQTTYDDGYRSLISAIIGQAVQDYAFPQSFSASGVIGKGSHQMAVRNRLDLERFFASDWCGTLCDGIGFPQEVLQNKGLLVDAGRRRRGKRAGGVAQ